MKKLNSKEIREKFLNYFEKNDHLKIKHSSVVPQNDPTLLFINSGMAPLKNYFLGKEQPPQPRLCNFQPCIRTKDIDDVGDRHHLTIFEMMGSWSIGDYYKEEACRLAYDLLVNEFGFDPKKLYMTVYGGNEAIGIKPDYESVEAWKKCGVSEDHIVMMGDDNFWGPAGETGPCGPCTEVFYDTGAEFGPEYKPGGHFDDVSRYIEIWNAGVFMELNKQKDGSFTSLPLKSVDTGSGLERMAMVMNGHESVYETDLLKPLMDIAGELLKNAKGEEKVKKTRMISDHIRGAVIILAEGVMPGNEGQGYIPRRLIRKCVAALVSNGVEKLDFSPLIDTVVELLSDYYPQLKQASETVKYTIQTEVNEFEPIIKSGLAKIEAEINANKGSKTFSGKVAFELVTTFGLPLEVIKSDLTDRGVELDEKAYEQCYEEHRKASRVISRKGGLTDDQEKLEAVAIELGKTNFTGYDNLKDTSKITGIILSGDSVDQANSNDDVIIVAEDTPFYAESGGQVGDIGSASTSGAQLEILDVMKVKDSHFHVAKVIQGTIKKGEEITFIVDEKNRNQVRRNHSATHLLHSALHKVVGKHATQKGSMVSAERLRFDFQHHQAVTRDELDQVEALVNDWVSSNNSSDTKLLEYEQALEAGAMALFGEKYDSKVRVVSFGDESVELCGGTHVSRTGDIGLFLISKEESVAKGIRRIEAVTGSAALELMQNRNKYLMAAAKAIGSRPEEVAERITDLKKKSAAKAKAKKEVNAGSATYKLQETIELPGNLKCLVAHLDEEVSAIKNIGDQLIDKGEAQIIFLIGKDDKSLKAFAWVNKEQTSKVKAGDFLKEVLAPVEGRGGGKPHFAQGGTPNKDALDQLFKSAQNCASSWLTSRLS